MPILEFSKIDLKEIKDNMTLPKRKRLLNNIMALILAQRLEVFNDEGGRSKWAPLNKKYAAWKSRRYTGSSKILSLTNALRQSFSASGGATKPSGDGEAIITDDSATLQTHVEYAAAQNFGATIMLPPSKRTEIPFKVFTSGEHEGRHRFASKKDVENGGKNFVIMNRGITTHRFGTYITIPKRPFDEFRDKDDQEINELTEHFVNG